MGTVIQFPEGARIARNRASDASDEPAAVIILPVIRIDREPDEPLDGIESGTRAAPGRRRRGRASRS